MFVQLSCGFTVNGRNIDSINLSPLHSLPVHILYIKIQSFHFLVSMSVCSRCWSSMNVTMLVFQ